MLKKNIQQMKTKAGTGKHAQNNSNENNNSSLSKSGRKIRKGASTHHVRTSGGKAKQATNTPLPQQAAQNKKSKDYNTKTTTTTTGGGRGGPEKTRQEATAKPDSKENIKKKSGRQKTKPSGITSKEEVTQMEEPPTLVQASSRATAAQPQPKKQRRSKRKPHTSHEQHVKQYFSTMTMSKKEKRVAAANPVAAAVPPAPVQDKMPVKLKEVKRKIEERTCARTRKKIKDPLKTAIDDDFEGAVNNFENNGKLFDEKKNPFWTEMLFDSREAEKEGIEVEGRLTSEHVIKYLEGTLTPIKPSTAKVNFDWTKSVDDMRSIDDVYFNDDAIMYHTLQNIIVHSERAVKRCTQDECCDRRRNSRSKSSDSIKKTESAENPPTSLLRFHLDRTEQVIYDRDKPIESIQKYLKQRENLQKWDALENYSCYL